MNKRAVLLAERLAEKRTASIPSACGGWAETAAACRLPAQDELDWRDILAPHWQSSAERMRACEVVLWGYPVSSDRFVIESDRSVISL
ncbi:transposase DNA-binding-containing protein [Cupriavidus sp. amp6]|uniref:transposase DNA-binding-containing protein n=1 Tax=Cupriavidus sp. amp6 TaxID=388051 RepID=UPI0035104527